MCIVSPHGLCLGFIVVWNSLCVLPYEASFSFCRVLWVKEGDLGLPLVGQSWELESKSLFWKQ